MVLYFILTFIVQYRNILVHTNLSHCPEVQNISREAYSLVVHVQETANDFSWSNGPLILLLIESAAKFLCPLNASKSCLEIIESASQAALPRGVFFHRVMVLLTGYLAVCYKVFHIFFLNASLALSKFSIDDWYQDILCISSAILCHLSTTGVTAPDFENKNCSRWNMFSYKQHLVL